MQESRPLLRLRGAAATSEGKVRERNEDAVAMNQEEGVFVVCDGMGGHHAGDIASALASGTILEMLCAARSSPLDREAAMSQILVAMAEANRRVFEAGQVATIKPSMGTTAVVLWQVDGHALLAHVGDSRCYRLRGGALEQLTRDHTVIEDARAGGNESALGPELVRIYAHVLTRSVGNTMDCRAVAVDMNVEEGDQYLLCTDGLTGAVRDDGIAAILQAAKSPEEAASALVDAANHNGGPDNVTALVTWAVKAPA